MPDCIYNGISYSDNSFVCQNGYEMRCDGEDGSWHPTGNTCDGDGKLVRQDSQAAKSDASDQKKSS